MTAVRLLRVPLQADCSPQRALRALAGDPWPFALTGRWAGGGAIVGSDPLRLAAPDDDPFALLDELPAVDLPHAADAVGGGGVADAGGAAVADASGGGVAEAGGGVADAVGGGWFGWLGFGLGARVERLAPPPSRPHPLPPFQLAYYDHVLRLDADGRWWFEALAAPEREAALQRRLTLLRDRLADVSAAPTSAAPAPATPPPREPFRIAGGGAPAHVAAVAECVERIAAGEIFQANVCLRFETAWEGDLAALYAGASERLHPAYGAAFPAPWGGVASLSPELFLRRRGRAVETGPIKGTIARAGGDDDPAAAAARAALAASAKDRAEHVMIVDLMRNDLGRVCAYGSIEAERAPVAEAHPGLWHLVSRVRGTLRPEVGDGELLRATFPPGSVTGAPKVQALHVIGELEGSGRELYTGAAGFASPLAGLELNVAIRTFEARDGRLWIGAGGGIVADSDPWAELEECHVKARPIVAAIGGEIAPHRAAPATAPTPATAPAPVPTTAPTPATAPAHRRDAAALQAARVPALPRALSRARHRPDPARGLFETLLVEDGRAARAAAHLARLADGAAALYGLPLPDDLGARVAEAAAAQPSPCRVRVAATPRPDGTLACAVTTGPLPARTLPVVLAPVVLPGGLGARKWLDRDLLDRLAPDGAIPPGSTALLLDGDGSLLEAAWGSVFALEGERLVTPPADGRILPGITRAALLEAAAAAGMKVREETIDLPRAAAADALLVSSALALALPARLAGADDDAPTAANELAARLRALLRGAVAATA
ncbi:bifunctional chorismate-binding protein/class IV aminotransferase [Conexibacter arvalis]|uniref:Para-aminobenzoate synthetase/4-amino-4-deoxychorismate lyase n=1 Tax=Conexibacter arvalis TaxID=912552 RepID=A0A840IE96_9ACTN|nr:bifunctional anthranilate synthase component I family protein/class IV aminotransferase [Conexibacter arvalis]MBB4663122.1 para-aminobenzoate synthetase/4-amino-4-deoxychorismate lyase [Conexibacter arvalis]